MSRFLLVPAFRIAAERCPVDALEEPFFERIIAGRPDMPGFIATQDPNRARKGNRP